MTCCQIRITQIAAGDVHTYALQVAGPANVNLLQLPRHNNTASEFNDINVEELQVNFPYDVNNFLESLMYDGITEIQHRCNRIIKELAGSTTFVNFLMDSYQFLSGLFHKFRIPPKKLKCNWCLLTSKLHTYLQSTAYLLKCKAAFNTATLTSDFNSICTRIHFDLLQMLTTATNATIAQRILFSNCVTPRNIMGNSKKAIFW